MRPSAALALSTSMLLVLSACSAAAGDQQANRAQFEDSLVTVSDTVPGESAGAQLEPGMAQLSANAATTFFADTPAVVVCDGSESAVARGTELAQTGGLPLLCGADLAQFESVVSELGAQAIFTVEGADATSLAEATGVEAFTVPADAEAGVITDGSLGEDVPQIAPPGTAEDDEGQSVLVYALNDLDSGPARATAEAAGATLVATPIADPRATSETVQAAAEHQGGMTIALGDAFGGEEDLTWKLQTAATGEELPGGGQLVTPGKTYIALYGTPVTHSLGVLGEQDVPATIARAEEMAGWYEDLTENTVIPTLEIIASVAIAAPGTRGTYTNVQTVETLRPLIDAAYENGQYVVLDLQPGREDFLTQAQEYEELLTLPHVGLALDPEWRLRPDQVHLRQIGQVDVAEVNEVANWLADLTRENNLPEKFLVLHSFQTRMIPDMDEVDQSREEIEVLVHVDGQGGQQAKQSTWNTLRNYAPSIEHWGWKNFIDEDIPMLTPEQTMDQVNPEPVFVSYQ